MSERAMSDFTPGTTAAGKPCKRCVSMGRRCADHRESSEGADRTEALDGKCNALRSDGSGKRCRQPAGARTDHLGYGKCWKHGGTSPNLRKAAQREMIEEACEQLGVPVETTPKEALTRLVWICAGDLEFYRSHVEELKPEALTWGRSRALDATGGKHGDKSETEYRAAVNVWLKLYHQAQDRLRAVTSEAIRCGLEERQVKLAEEQGRMIAQLLERLLPDLGVNPKDADVREKVGRALRAIDGGKAA